MKHHITEILWMRCLSMDSQFCEAVVCCGYLTQEQMLHAVGLLGGVTAYPCLAYPGGSCDRRTEATEDRPRGLYNRILTVMCRQTR